MSRHELQLAMRLDDAIRSAPQPWSPEVLETSAASAVSAGGDVYGASGNLDKLLDAVVDALRNRARVLADAAAKGDVTAAANLKKTLAAAQSSDTKSVNSDLVKAKS